MRFSTILFAVCAMAGPLVAFGAHATGATYAVAAGAGRITITPTAPWRVSKSFPWRAKCGPTIHDKSKFALTDVAASLSGVTGSSCEITGALCTSGTCEPFKTSVNF